MQYSGVEIFLAMSQGYEKRYLHKESFDKKVFLK